MINMTILLFHIYIIGENGGMAISRFLLHIGTNCMVFVRFSVALTNILSLQLVLMARGPV
jgi:hypothetical protein